MSVPMDPPRIAGPGGPGLLRAAGPARNEVLAAARKLVERFKGRRAICVVGEEVFAVPQYLRAGLANVMMDYVLQPELARKLAAIARDYHVELYRLLIDAGVEIVALGDDYAGKTGTYMSPAHFREFILPGLRHGRPGDQEPGGLRHQAHRRQHLGHHGPAALHRAGRAGAAGARLHAPG